MRELVRQLQQSFITTLAAVCLSAGVAHADPVITGRYLRE